MFTLYASSIRCAAQCTPCTAQCTPCTAQCTPCTAGCSCRRRAMTPLSLPTMTLASSLPKPTNFSCHSISATPRLVITVEMAARIPGAFARSTFTYPANSIADPIMCVAYIYHLGFEGGRVRRAIGDESQERGGLDVITDPAASYFGDVVRKVPSSHQHRRPRRSRCTDEHAWPGHDTSQTSCIVCRMSGCSGWIAFGQLALIPPST